MFLQFSFSLKKFVLSKNNSVIFFANKNYVVFEKMGGETEEGKKNQYTLFQKQNRLKKLIINYVWYSTVCTVLI